MSHRWRACRTESNTKQQRATSKIFPTLTQIQGEFEESWQPDWTEKYSTYQSALCKEFMPIENSHPYIISTESMVPLIMQQLYDINE